MTDVTNAGGEGPRLTADEAELLVARCQGWPGTWSHVLEPVSRDEVAAGWAQLAWYDVTAPPGVADVTRGGTALYCPVVLLHEVRRAGREEPSEVYQARHLEASRVITAALAETWGVARRHARAELYHLLRTRPERLAKALARYAREERAERSGPGGG